MGDQGLQAAVFGATGLCGNALIEFLSSKPRWSKIYCYYRASSTSQKLPTISEKVEWIEIDFDRLPEYGERIQGDHLFCCLGSTIKKAGSKDRFREIDFSYVRKLARLAQVRGIRGFHVISSMGVHLNSPFFYQRVKAEMESAVLEIPFLQTRIYRPSLLDGKRKEQRKMEKFFLSLVTQFESLLIGPLKFLKSTSVDGLAKLMIHEAENFESNKKIFEAEAIRDFSRSLS